MWVCAIAAIFVAACNLISGPDRTPPPKPVETPTPSPTPTPTPEATPTPEGNEAAIEAANEAEQKARQAAKKAAEAAAVAAEASAAARDAARAAAKAVAASRRGTPLRHTTPKESARPSVSPTPTPTETMTPVPETSTPEASAAATAPPEQAEQDVEHLAEQLKNLDRAKMNEADAQRYDIANGLLISARRSLSKNDYMAANSLVEKAKVLIQGIGH